MGLTRNTIINIRSFVTVISLFIRGCGLFPLNTRTINMWSSGQGFWLQIQRSRVRFPALPDFLRGIGPGTVYSQPREPREVN